MVQLSGSLTGKMLDLNTFYNASSRRVWNYKALFETC